MTEDKNQPDLTVLAVDDIQDYLDVIADLLGSRYRVITANSGIKALKIAQSEEPPDLILQDVNMPGMTGFDIARQLKADPATRDIPIIFVTAQTDSRSIREGFTAGAVDYVTKPFNAEELMARVETHLNLKEARERLEEMSQQLGKYLSPTVYESIVNGKKEVKIGSYRKVLTVCFTDIVGFTPRAESMDEHELTAWINRYFDDMARIVLAAGGTLDKFMGDALMVFFGDPDTRGVEQDALACVNMARQMLERAAVEDLKIRVGINTGMCTIGNFGSADRMDYTILGKEVNLTARLESSAQPGQILISESTCDLVQDTITCTHQGEMRMKGIARPIVTYSVD